MCLATVYDVQKPSEVILEYVSKIEVDGNTVIFTDIMGEKTVVEGTIAMADLTGGVVKVRCA